MVDPYLAGRKSGHITLADIVEMDRTGYTADEWLKDAKESYDRDYTEAVQDIGQGELEHASFWAAHAQGVYDQQVAELTILRELGY